ncbi:MAG: hypothetical protein JRE81_00415 [Deltaproteobacteria bacterium]|jgi:hypothetical protein|nr:hypothetical protein [Deltaproteobacteria bacterium]
MVRRATRWFRGFLLLPLLLAGCGRDIVDKTLDEPCTRTEQCEAGLECTAGVCRPVEDAGVDASD